MRWIKSSLSDLQSATNCVEVAFLENGDVLVRDSKDPNGPMMHYTPGEWDAFIGGAKLGEFDDFGKV
jgi:hypothetical protein